jgi:hypothetical protein
MSNPMVSIVFLLHVKGAMDAVENMDLKKPG